MNRRAFLGGSAVAIGGLYAGLGTPPARAATDPVVVEDGSVPLITRLADFVDATGYDDLPAEVIAETKRILLDTIGCGLSAHGSDKGRWGIDFVREYFAGPEQATVIGYGDRLSIPGAAFANAELVNALDHEMSMLPGHVTPYVLSPILAVAERNRRSGKDLITACALAHEIGNRIGANMGTFRDVVDAEHTSFPLISGSSSCVFGGAGAIAKLEQMPGDKVAEAMGLAGNMAPMQSHTTMIKNLPTTTSKHLMAGWAAQEQITAVALVRAGHRGDIHVLDRDWGYWRFAGAIKWDGPAVVAGLGEDWRFHKTVRYKWYPACGILRGALDCLASVIRKNVLRPGEIEHIHAFIEPSCMEPVFSNRNISNQVEAQFSVAYNLAVMAHGVERLHWQDHETMTRPDILEFMEKVSFEPHPQYDATLKRLPKSRVAKIIVSARGRTFEEERPFAKGSPSPDPSTYMTDDDLELKFRENTSRILPQRKTEEAYRQLTELENVDDVGRLMQVLHA